VGGCHCSYNTKWRKKTLAWRVDLPSVFTPYFTGDEVKEKKKIGSFGCLD
jgi:hypothetical protein